MEESKFREKMGLLCDPYFDREFFTNLIYCIDREKSVRQIFEAVVYEINCSPQFTEELDKGLLHLFYAYQASSLVRENYQWLPIGQGIYTLSLFCGDGQHLVKRMPGFSQLAKATTLEDFENLIRAEVRGVESMATAWGGFLFLLENRTSRAKAISAIVREALRTCDALTFELLIKAFDLALAGGWKSNALVLLRAFERFWAQPSNSPEAVTKGLRLATTGNFLNTTSADSEATLKGWSKDWTEEIWRRASSESAESVWNYYEKLMSEGASFEALFQLQTLMRGRCLYAMKSEQWPTISRSIQFGDALHSASRWISEMRLALLATDLQDLVEVVQLTALHLPSAPTGESVLDGVSKNISKDRLVLRLDDAVERGERVHALELMAVILKDEGLTHSIRDRLILMASKQDGWTSDMKTLPLVSVLTAAFDGCLRLNVRGPSVSEGLFGVLRFLGDQREISLQVVAKTGTYGEGLLPSQFDVSGGARNVDRFVFNQLRNAQRVKVWPLNN